ncbi:MAG: hypothetical protein AAF388_13955 [Bacteroidota bacterium]
MNKVTNRTQDELLLSKIINPNPQGNRISDLLDNIIIWDKKYVIPDGYHLLTFEIIRDHEGRIQWIFPTNNLFPVHTTMAKGITKEVPKSKKYLSRLLFSSGLRSIGSSETVTILFQRKPMLMQEITNIPHHSYGILFNYQSGMEKALVVLTHRNVPSYVIKVPFTSLGHKYHEKEKANLEALKHVRLTKSILPVSIPTKQTGVYAYKVYHTPTAKQARLLTGLHMECLMELYKLPTASSGIFSYVQEMEEQLSEIAPEYDHSLILIKELFAQFKGNSFLPVGWGNGQFIPGVLEVLPDQINMNNWERSSSDLPLFFDWFQFNYHASSAGSLSAIADEVTSSYPQILEKWTEEIPLHTLHACFALHFMLNEIDGILIKDPVNGKKNYALSDVTNWLKKLSANAGHEQVEFEYSHHNNLSYHL